MAGESYGGQYIPIYAAAVHDQNKALMEAGIQPINLKSVMIGNGMTNSPLMGLSYYDMSCTPASVDPVQNIETCVRMKTALPRCEKMIKESCTDTFDAIGCSAANMFCSSEITQTFYQLGLNVYDISKKCSEEEMSTSLCYPIISTIGEYLNQPSVRKTLGVSSALKNETVGFCNSDVLSRFSGNLDQYRSHTPFYLESLLERGVKVLIYVGALDWICNWVGNHRMVEALEWHGAENFRKEELRSWSVVEGEEKSKAAGLVKSSGDLTFLTVYGAGHMVPYDKPTEALEVLTRWLANEKF